MLDEPKASSNYCYLGGLNLGGIRVSGQALPQANFPIFTYSAFQSRLKTKNSAVPFKVSYILADKSLGYLASDTATALEVNPDKSMCRSFGEMLAGELSVGSNSAPISYFKLS